MNSTKLTLHVLFEVLNLLNMILNSFGAIILRGRHVSKNHAGHINKMIFQLQDIVL